MSYTRWNALRATDGFSTTMSRYSQNEPSQCCSRKWETSSFLSTIEMSGFVLVGIGVQLRYAARSVRSDTPDAASRLLTTIDAAAGGACPTYETRACRRR